jgi:hypothetical protein
MLGALGAARAEVEGPDLSKRIAEAGKIDAVLDLVGNSTKTEGFRLSPWEAGQEARRSSLLET